MGENDALLFLLGESDGLLPESSYFAVAPFGDAEDLRMPNGSYIIFYSPIAGISNWCTATDHVDLSTPLVFGG